MRDVHTGERQRVSSPCLSHRPVDVARVNALVGCRSTRSGVNVPIVSTATDFVGVSRPQRVRLVGRAVRKRRSMSRTNSIVVSTSDDVDVARADSEQQEKRTRKTGERRRFPRHRFVLNAAKENTRMTNCKRTKHKQLDNIAQDTIISASTFSEVNILSTNRSRCQPPRR
jgi:superfamily II DNA or RNA helicase